MKSPPGEKERRKMRKSFTIKNMAKTAIFSVIIELSIVGFPWGLQHFKMAIATVFPFGKRIRKKQ